MMMKYFLTGDIIDYFLTLRLQRVNIIACYFRQIASYSLIPGATLISRCNTHHAEPPTPASRRHELQRAIPRDDRQNAQKERRWRACFFNLRNFILPALPADISWLAACSKLAAECLLAFHISGHTSSDAAAIISSSQAVLATIATTLTCALDTMMSARRSMVSPFSPFQQRLLASRAQDKLPLECLVMALDAIC